MILSFNELLRQPNGLASSFKMFTRFNFYFLIEFTDRLIPFH
jgi:hypothetical protein